MISSANSKMQDVPGFRSTSHIHVLYGYMETRVGQTDRQTDLLSNSLDGSEKTHLESGDAENRHRTANSAQMVLPLLVGAPTNTSSFLLCCRGH